MNYQQIIYFQNFVFDLASLHAWQFNNLKLFEKMFELNDFTDFEIKNLW
jgi:hypothetical protein